MYGGRCPGGIRRLNHIFAVTIRWSEDTPTKED